MGRDAYLITYRASKLPRDYEFFDLLQDMFGSECGCEISIEETMFDEWVEECTHTDPKFKERYEESIAAVRTHLKNSKYGNINLSVG